MHQNYRDTKRCIAKAHTQTLIEDRLHAKTAMRSSDPSDFSESDIEYDPITGKYHLSFDPEEISRPSMVVVHFVAHLTDTSSLSLPQIQSVIDADSLDTWLLEAHDYTGDSEVTFTYAGYRVALDNLGNMWAEPIEDTEEDTNDSGEG